MAFSHSTYYGNAVVPVAFAWDIFGKHDVTGEVAAWLRKYPISCGKLPDPCRS